MSDHPGYTARTTVTWTVLCEKHGHRNVKVPTDLTPPAEPKGVCPMDGSPWELLRVERTTERVPFGALAGSPELTTPSTKDSTR